MTAEREAMTLERQAFEKCGKERCLNLRRFPDGRYESLLMQSEWEGWWERAQLSRAAEPVATTAESKLVGAGVFKGQHGLRGLLDANAFWERQLYGTRLYYGGGIADYLHRDVLDAAVKLLDTHPPEPARDAPVFDFAAHLQRQRDWSGKTFGPGARAQGVVDHIRKELREIEADPGDLKEWIDVVILALDGAWRSGASPAEIIAALVAKQTKNEGRVWPDWRTADPNKAIEHDRSHDAAMAQESGDATV